MKPKINQLNNLEEMSENRGAGKFLKQASKESVLEQYDLLEKLGSGSFAVVKKARHKQSGKLWAMKIITRNNSGANANLEMIEREISIMGLVEHPNIIFMKEVFDTPGKLYLVLELVTGGELFDRIVKRGTFSEHDASHCLKQIIEGLSYLHEKGIVHRDLKPENLLYADDRDDSPLKIADFGLSKILFEDEMTKTACGTPGYVAPEVLRNVGYGSSADMWSAGVILYILLCGYPPFFHENIQKLFEQIMLGDFSFPDEFWGDISDEAKDLIRKLLKVDPTKRLTAEQALQHPWLRESHNISKLNLNNTLQTMRTFNARRKFKMAVFATVLARNMLK